MSNYWVAINYIATYYLHMEESLERTLRKAKFSSEYAKTKGISPRMLSYYVSKGQLIRLGHDLYSFPENLSFNFEDLLKEKLIQIPNGIVGGHTALYLMGLTEEPSKTFEIYVSEKNRPKRKLNDVTLFSTKANLIDLGVIRMKRIRVTSIERTIVDLLRRKSGSFREALDIISQAKSKKMNISFSELLKLAEAFRAKKKIEILLEML